jgi:DNA repair exonuclease SbcCD ATPase subunit
MDPDQSLLELVFNRLAEDGVPDKVATLVLAAYTGEHELQATLAGESAELPVPDAHPGQQTDPLYIEAVTVAGFRGVGPPASLRLQPHAGLTLVVGRNGSGKSSFAEAAELALTGDSARWAERNSVFREGWRNLHDSANCTIEVTVRADGAAAPTRISRTWQPEHTEPSQAESRVLTGGIQYRDTGELGWAQPLQTYRPFLTANDVGRLISTTPSGLFDALAPILGIEPITEADRRLTQARKLIDDRVKAVKASRLAFRDQLGGVDDDRAQAAAAILAKAQPDLDALEAVLAAADEQSDDPAASACRRLVEGALPDPTHAEAVADAIDGALSEVAARAAGTAHAADQTAQMLELAVAYRAEHGDGPCPVCGGGALDTTWQARATETLARLHAERAAAREASQRLAEACNNARALLAMGTLIGATDIAAAAAALGAHADHLRAQIAGWQAIDRDATAQQLSTHLRSAYPPLHHAFAQARAAANEWLRGRHDAWRLQATALQEWLGKARTTPADEVWLARIKTAREWLKRAADDVRAARLAPFAQQSQEIWQRLRQESNVELAGMRLDGTATRRRVAFPATVDGTATSAMSVMSQGELQALGLAVFLPRACAQDSPFKFLIIDDPVHSMDPSKVDGLAQVLEDLAKQRQVIVFTHDNRLPEAVRRLQIDATIWEVLRREGSVVELRKNLDPVKRYLDDANALAKTSELPDEVRRPVVAGFCRSAIEAVSHERIRRQRITAGHPHAGVEELIDGAHTLTQTVALALFDDARQGVRVLPTLDSIGGWAANAFKACQDNVHGSARGSLESLVTDTTRLVKELR